MSVANKIKTSQIKVIKVDEDYNEFKLENVEFQIYEDTNKNGKIDREEKVVDTIKTNSEGIAVTKELPIDKEYIILETKTRTDYHLNTESQKVTFTLEDYKKVTTLTFTNKKKEGKIHLTKVDLDNNKVTLGHVGFRIYSEELKSWIKYNEKTEIWDRTTKDDKDAIYYTNVNGEILLEHLRVGKVRLLELETNKWYNKVAEEHDATVEYNKTTEVIVENELKKGSIEVVKIDADEKEIKLQGVKFNVLDNNGNILETIETNKDGIAETKRYPIRDFEELTLQEIETLETYELNDVPKKIVLEEGKINIVFENNPKKGNIKIVKIDEYDNSIFIEGAKFDLYEDTDRDGKITDKDKFLETIETNEDGIATSKNYRIDRQYLGVESYVPDNYVLDNTVFSFSLEWNKTIEKVRENKPKTIQIKVIKQDEEDKTPIQNVVFEIYEDTNKNGRLDPEEKLVDTITTNEEGIATSKDINYEEHSKILRCDRQYILKESKHPDTYLDLENQILDFTEYIKDYKEDIVKELTLYNIPKKGKIKIIKVDEYDNSIFIEGAKFDLYEDTDRDGEITSNDKFLETIETSKEGIAISNDYRIDRDYLYTEKFVNDNYALDTNAYKFSLEWNKTIEKTATNKPKTFQIQVIKVDAKDNTIRIPNVEFEIYEDVNENGELDEVDILIDTITTNEEGIAVSKNNDFKDKSKILRVDTKYILFESKHNIKYIDDEIQEVLDYTKYLTNGEYKEGLQVDLEIENTPIEVTPEPKKIDRFTGKPLEGAEFDIYEDTNGNGIFDNADIKVRHYVTNSEGTAKIEPLRCNTYFWFEVKPPVGYTLDENIYTFKVENQNQIIILKSEDKIIENDIELYKKAKNDSIKYGINKDEGVPETYFALYLIDENGDIIDFAKDKYENYIGEKIIIDGIEYYAIITDETGKVQVTVPYGKYLFKEIKSHDLFLNDSKDNIIDVLDDGKKVILEFYNTAVNLELDISKTGINQAQPNDVIRYDFPNLINKSNVSLDNFTWEDHLPSKYTKIKSLYTGTWNEDLIYRIFYKTNKNDYKEFGNGYSTLKNHFIDFESLGLNNEDEEYITDFKIVFGTVKSGFTYEEEPFIFVIVDDDIEKDDEWTNKTRLTGNYTDLNGNLTELIDEDEYTTITYKEELKITILPRTGTELSVNTILIRIISIVIVISLVIILKRK